MTLFHLLNTVNWPEVQAALTWNYREDAATPEQYQFLLAQLKQMKPEPGSMRILVERLDPASTDDGKEWANVSGLNGTLNREQPEYETFRNDVGESFADSEVRFSLAFTPRDQWLGMEVEPESFSHYRAAEIAAHCLWEMSFHGFSEAEIQSTMAELQDRSDELEFMSPEEREQYTISLDQPIEDVAGEPSDPELL